MAGRTIIEKFEEEAEPANYAFVLSYKYRNSYQQGGGRKRDRPSS